MGCATALGAALIAPQRIDRLVLVTPPTAWATRSAQREVYEAAARLVERGGVTALVEARGSIPLSSTASLASSLLRGASSAVLAASGGRSSATEACLVECPARARPGFEYRPSTSTGATPWVAAPGL